MRRRLLITTAAALGLPALAGCAAPDREAAPPAPPQVQAAPPEAQLILPQPEAAGTSSPYLAQPATAGAPVIDQQVDAGRLNREAEPPGGRAATFAQPFDRGSGAVPGAARQDRPAAVVASPSRDPGNADTVADRIRRGDVIGPVADPTGQIVGAVAPPGGETVSPNAPQPQRQTPPPQGDFTVVGPGSGVLVDPATGVVVTPGTTAPAQ